MTLRRWIERASLARKPWSSIASTARLRRRFGPLLTTSYIVRISPSVYPGWPFAEGRGCLSSRRTLRRASAVPAYQSLRSARERAKDFAATILFIRVFWLVVVVARTYRSYVSGSR